MSDCKHDWHFIEGTERLQCRRCKAETGPRDYDDRTRDMFEELDKTVEERIQEARQAELDACCDLLEGMHAASTGNHNYYLHAAVELRRLRAGK